jgi:hypothetical protein
MWFKANKKPDPILPIKLEELSFDKEDLKVLNEANEVIRDAVSYRMHLSRAGEVALSALLYRYADQLCSPSDRDDGL